MGVFRRHAMMLWYSSNLDNGMYLIYLAPLGAAWYFYFLPIGRQELTLGLIPIMVGVHFYILRRIRRSCYGMIHGSTASFLKDPKIEAATSEDLLDSFDTEILKVVDDLREERGDYVKLLPLVSRLMETEELLQRLGKMRALNLVRALPHRVTLTPIGMDMLSTSRVRGLSKVTPRYSSKLARARIEFDGGNYNGVIDHVNILLEDVLKDALIEKFRDSLATEWRKLQDRGKVGPDFEHANLGALHRVCKETGVVVSNPTLDHLLWTFLSIRNPQKHSSDSSVDPEMSARTALDIAEMFARHWFK